MIVQTWERERHSRLHKNHLCRMKQCKFLLCTSFRHPSHPQFIIIYFRAFVIKRRQTHNEREIRELIYSWRMSFALLFLLITYKFNIAGGQRTSGFLLFLSLLIKTLSSKSTWMRLLNFHCSTQFFCAPCWLSNSRWCSCRGLLSSSLDSPLTCPNDLFSSPSLSRDILLFLEADYFIAAFNLPKIIQPLGS